jgi:NAD(P)-dependent dehydrogenase (short-subunit alcohol dehydrogenase family)
MTVLKNAEGFQRQDGEDLASLASVRRFSEQLSNRHRTLDLLINNAGVMSPPQRQTTQDGFELQLGTNYLAHFALTARLFPLLHGTAAPRVVMLSSLAHRNARIQFDDLQFERRYSPWMAYSQARLWQKSEELSQLGFGAAA